MLLELDGDLAMRMVDGIDQYLMNAIKENTENRNRIWEAGTSSDDTYSQFIESKRKLLVERLALTDERDPVTMQWVGNVDMVGSKPFSTDTALVGENELYSIYEVKWNTFRQVEGSGFLLVPKGDVLAVVVAVPDAGQSPEDIVGLGNSDPQTLPFAGLLAQQNCVVIVPTLINRKDTYSGVPEIRMTNQPHREYLWRASYVMGRTVIGYEIQKIVAALDWAQTEMPSLPLGIAGYGEGGLLALYTAAMNKEVDTSLVGGYFQSGEHLWQQPIDRNVWKLRQDFGEAEIAALIAPRRLIVEASSHPNYDGPPNTPNRSGAAPGRLVTPDIQSVKDEFNRAKKMVPDPSGYELIENNNIPMGEDALNTFLKSLGIETKISDAVPIQISKGTKPEQRHKNQFDQILEDTQFLMRESEFTRKEFWADADASSPELWEKSTQEYKDYFLKNIIGELPESMMPLNPRSKQIYDEPNYTGYQVVMDVYPGVYAYGILLLPKDFKPGEQRPVVVCQHGLEGRPGDVADPTTDHYAYHQYACQLADQGFVTFSPQNPYIGEDRFRVLLRKGQPLGITLFSFIVRQHERILEWLVGQPYVDADRVAFYGLSYGGKTAMRIPALLDGYCLSICSADYNEWIWKNVSARHSYSYLLTGEYDMPEFNLGNTFNYAEMSQLIFPRPFMVERGHHDGVAPSEWVAYEYARTQRHYDLMGLGDRTEIEFFNGPHTINGKGTFAFLHKHLNFEQIGNAGWNFMIYDAIVIGVGGMGSAALYHLAKKGMRVLGIEQFNVPHTMGSSHGHTRVIRKAYFEHPSYVPLLQKAYDMWETIEEDSGQQLVNYCGMIYAGKPGSPSIQGVKKSSKLYSVPVQELSASELKTQYPQFSFDDDMVGLYEPSGGYLLVEECVKAHSEQAQKHNADLLINTPVKSWKHENELYVVDTNQGEFQAKSLVVSGGGWTSKLLQELNLPLTIQRIPSGWFEPKNDQHTLENGFLIFGIETHDGFFYGFPVLDERGVKIARYEGSETVSGIDAIDRIVQDSDVGHIQQFITQYMSGVTKQVNDSSICIYTVTPDSHFIIDQHPHHENLYIAAGFSGHGFKFSSAVGAVLADLVCEGKTDVDISFFGLERFASSKNH